MDRMFDVHGLVDISVVFNQDEKDAFLCAKEVDKGSISAQIEAAMWNGNGFTSQICSATIVKAEATFSDDIDSGLWSGQMDLVGKIMTTVRANSPQEALEFVSTYFAQDFKFFSIAINPDGEGDMVESTGIEECVSIEWDAVGQSQSTTFQEYFDLDATVLNHIEANSAINIV